MTWHPGRMAPYSLETTGTDPVTGRTIAPLIDVGDRVILTSARARTRDVLGYVIARDPYPDRDAVVLVLHEDGRPRWRRRDALRALGCRMSREDLVADLTGMGLAHLAAGLTGPDGEVR